jgi:hypothetical protein
MPQNYVRVSKTYTLSFQQICQTSLQQLASFQPKQKILQTIILRIVKHINRHKTNWKPSITRPFGSDGNVTKKIKDKSEKATTMKLVASMCLLEIYIKKCITFHSILILCTRYKTQKLMNLHIKLSTTIIAPRYASSEEWQNQRTSNRWPLKMAQESVLLQTIPSNAAIKDLIT